MKFSRSALSFILVILTPLLSFVTFEEVSYSSIYYDFNGIHQNYSSKIRIGNPINLPHPLDVLITSSGEGQVHEFEGWYSNSDLFDAFEIVFMPHQDLRVYAKWSLITWNGNSFQNYLLNMAVSQLYQVNVNYSGGQFFIFSFRPSFSRSYRFQSSSIPGTDSYQDTQAYLYNDPNLSAISYSTYIIGNNGHFRIDHNLAVGRTYFLKVLFYFPETTGSFYVSVT